MKLMLIGLLLVSTSLPVSGEVIVVVQFSDIETSASSHCQGEPEPEPDFHKHFVDVVIGTNPVLESQMSSVCGSAGMDARLSAIRASGEISGSFGAGSSLTLDGGGYSSLVASITVRVDETTTYTLSCSGATEETGVPHWGAIEIAFSGGSIHHTSDQAEEFELEWTGVLEPGTDYTLHMAATSTRVSRYLPGGPPIGMDGTTSQTVSYSLRFDADVVAETPASVGRLKTLY